MKFSLAWLGRYVDLSNVDLEWLAERFTLSVAELEGVEYLGRGLEKAVIARIEEVAPHPDAQKLVICQVDDGSGTRRQVVCGAPNAEAAMTSVLLPPGSRMGDREIGVATLRGVESFGMLASTMELGLNDDHGGICDLPATLAPGTLLSSLVPLQDTLFEVDNKSITHRPDLWGHLGIARELAGLLERDLKHPELCPDEGNLPPLQVEVADGDLCPKYTALGMAGIQIKPSPLWMQALLHRCGVRPINNIVDATNFVMLEMGNPLHAFDARQVKGSRIIVRRAVEGEEVETLDDKNRSLCNEDLLICDGDRPVALAGVMGLANSEVADDTAALVLEAATFRADQVRRTSLRLGLRTESSMRFEKSLDPTLPERAAKRFAQVVTEVSPGATVTHRMASVGLNDFEPEPIRVSVSYINRRLGTALPPEQIHGFLRSLEFTVDDLDGDNMRVGVPTFRATKDVTIPEDIVEEVGRLYGYDSIIPVQPAVTIPTPFRHPDRTLHRRIRTHLSFGANYAEAQTYSFDAEPMLARIGANEEARIGLRNPLSAEATHLRAHLLPNLLTALENSLPHRRRLKLYEIGRVFQPGGDNDKLPPQPYRLCMVWWTHEQMAQTSLGKDATVADLQRHAFSELKGDVEALFSRLNLPVVISVDEGVQNPWLHPVRRAIISLESGHELGRIAALHPTTAAALESGYCAAAMEIDLSACATNDQAEQLYRPVPKFPSVPFDLSIIVPENVRHGAVAERIQGAHPEWVRALELTGIYRGDPIPDGQKSMTYHIRFQASDRTLEMGEVNELVDKMVAHLERDLGGWLRK